MREDVPEDAAEDMKQEIEETDGSYAPLNTKEENRPQGTAAQSSNAEGLPDEDSHIQTAIEEMKEQSETVDPQHFSTLLECYQTLYQESALEYLTEDLEFAVTSIGNNARVHRIRALITDLDLSHNSLKSSHINQVLFSSVRMVKMFQTPLDKARHVHHQWIKKLAQFINPQFSP